MTTSRVGELDQALREIARLHRPRLIEIEWSHEPESSCGGESGPAGALRPDGEKAEFGDGGEPGAWMARVGKKTAGRELDGRTWDDIPEAES